MGTAKLKVTSPAGEACVYPLHGVQFTVGRAAPYHGPDIVLTPDPQGWVSRLHCILDLRHGRWWVTDHSSNGTLLRRDTSDPEVRPVRGRELLEHGDTLLVLGDMAARGGGLPGVEAVACGHGELITALWGTPDEWPPGRCPDRTDLAGVVRAVRLRLEPDPARPRVLETVPSIGYRLYVVRRAGCAATTGDGA